MIRQSTICAVSLLALLAPSSVSAQPHDHDHGKHVEFKKPETYKAAVEEIQLRIHEIDHLIKTKELENVHGRPRSFRKSET
ncbi:MAG: hypothetical protein IPK83_20985 [Planctomycetes bacterium]|nr:hypothetical protein [Planctomycetota bacterium]